MIIISLKELQTKTVESSRKQGCGAAPIKKWEKEEFPAYLESLLLRGSAFFPGNKWSIAVLVGWWLPWQQTERLELQSMWVIASD